VACRNARNFPSADPDDADPDDVDLGLGRDDIDDLEAPQVVYTVLPPAAIKNCA
jgi:hypothetical protein